MTIPEILSQLQHCTGELPREALKEAIEQREAITPELLRIIENTTANLAEVAKDEDSFAHIYAMYLLAQFREKRAYPLLVDLATADHELVDIILGDFITEALGRILASVCHGDTSLIERMIENPKLDGFVRSAGLSAFVVLVAEGAKSREEVMAYFKSLFHGGLQDDDYVVWSALVGDSCDIYPAEVMPEIEQAYADGLTDPMYMSLSEVKKVLEAGKERTLEQLAQDPRRRFIDDTIGELETWGCFNEWKVPSPVPSVHPAPASRPAPIRTGPKIGRNEPCPCGSGKKYKKCCGR